MILIFGPGRFSKSIFPLLTHLTGLHSQSFPPCPQQIAPPLTRLAIANVPYHCQSPDVENEHMSLLFMNFESKC